MVADRAEVIGAAAADAASGEEAVDIHSLDLDVNVFWKVSLGFCCCCVKN